MSVLYAFLFIGYVLMLVTLLLSSSIPLQLILLIWGFYIIITLLVLAPFGLNYFAKEKLTVNDLRESMNLFQQDPTDKQVLFSLFESFSRAKKSYPLLLYSFLLCFNPQLRKKFKVATRQVLSAHPTNELIYKSISRLMAEYHYLDIKGMYDATLDALKKNPSVLSLARFAYKWGIKYYHRQHEGKMTVQDKIYYENKIMGDIARCSGFGKENL